MVTNHYKCSNSDCKVDVELSVGIPIYMHNTPADLRKLTVRWSPKSAQYLLAHKSEMFCWECKKIVWTIGNSHQCINCGAFEDFLKPGWACHVCNLGVILEIEGDRIWSD